MHRTALTLTLLAMVVLALPAGAHDAHGNVDEPVCYQIEVDEEGNPTGPRFCTEEVWFHDSGTKAGNVAATGHTSFPTWDTRKPSKSVTAGAGGGYASNGTPRQQQGVSDPMFGATFDGAFTGNIDNLAVTLYLFAPGRQQETTYYGGVDLVVDGETILTINDGGLPLRSGGNAVLKTEFVLTGLHEALKLADIEIGEDVKHDVRLFFTSYALATTTSVIVYDTTEVPSGMTFNIPGDLEGRHQIAA